jgi:transcriptional regulator with XRE-family HTH domain
MRSKTFQAVIDQTPKDVKIFVDLYGDLVVRINQLLREKGIKKRELAAKLDKKPSEISKWLSGEHNFTLRSLAKLSAELDEPLLEVPKRKTPSKFIEYGGFSSSKSMVAYNRMESLTQSRNWIVNEDPQPYKTISDAG